MNLHSQVLCLMGPTASGKTRLALDLVSHYPCQIISVDSAMVYRGMDIGSAKPTQEELQKAPHRLVNLCEPTDSYSVGRFYRDVLAAINDVVASGDVPLLVGGTMQYFHRLQHGLAQLPESDAVIRRELEQRISEEGLTVLHDELMRLDPVAAQRIHPNDRQRIQRALEVWYVSGRCLTDWLADGNVSSSAVECRNVVLWPEERAWLHRRIEQRFDAMLQQGLIEEVEALYHRPGMHADLPSMRCVGYKQVWDYLGGRYDRATLREKGVIATRQLAKRQLTWLRSWPDTHELIISDEEQPQWSDACFDQFFNISRP